jgi:hypothetical protein
MKWAQNTHIGFLYGLPTFKTDRGRFAKINSFHFIYKELRLIPRSYKASWHIHCSTSWASSGSRQKFLRPSTGSKGGCDMKKRNERGIFVALALLLAVTVFVSITAFTPHSYRLTYTDESISSPVSPDAHSRGSRSL